VAARKLSAKKAIDRIEGYDSIVSELSDLIESARRVSARSVNAVITATYWEIGRRIVESEQRGKKRAGYGEALLERLAADLTTKFGRGFGARLRQHLQLYSVGEHEGRRYLGNLRTESAWSGNIRFNKTIVFPNIESQPERKMAILINLVQPADVLGLPRPLFFWADGPFDD
jgi:hypothetical protein